MKDNIILDIAVVFGISMAMAVLSGCITVVLLRTVLHPPGIGCSADTNGSTHDKDGHKPISFADYFKIRAYAEEI